MTESKPNLRSVGRPLIGDRRMTNAEYLRRHRAKKALLQVHKHCPECNKRLRKTSRDICVACWLKTDDGRDYLRLKKIESRAKTINVLIVMKLAVNIKMKHMNAIP